MPGEYVGWIRTSQTSCNSICLVIKETCGLALSWWKITCFLLTNSGCFSLSAAFSWSNWEQYLLELIVWFSGRRIIGDSLLIPPCTQHHLLWLKTSLWCGWWWFISLVPRSLPFHIIVQYPLFICFKNGMFSLHLSRESHVEICSRRFFLLKLCGTQTSKRLT